LSPQQLSYCRLIEARGRGYASFMTESAIRMPQSPAGRPAEKETAGGRQAEIADATAPANNRRTSALLRDYVASLSGDQVSLDSLRDTLGDRGFGVLLFVFAVPNLIPVNIPLLSAVLGAPLVLLAAQLFYGRHKPWFPRWFASRSVSRANFEAVVLRAIPYLERAEALLRPRLTPLLSWTGERLIGLALLVLTVVLALPIPFGNWLPAFAICIIGLAIVEKDGLAVLIGIAVGLLSLLVAGTVVVGLMHAFFLLLSGLFP
jgi:hypothetical protein